MNDLPKVILYGAAGRMGRTITYRFLEDGIVDYVAALDKSESGKFAGELTQSENLGPEIFQSVEDIPSELEADLVLDFSIGSAVRENLEPSLERGWDYIIGATGFDKEDHEYMTKLAGKHRRRIVLVPNFTYGINLMLRFVREAARLYKHAEIIELHHDRKIDSPSGTAIFTAQEMANVRENVPAPCPGDYSRGKTINEIPVHSVRLPGLVAHQEVIFGGLGETLTIRHDTTDRQAFLNGIYLAIKNLKNLEPGFVMGLDWALDFK